MSRVLRSVRKRKKGRTLGAVDVIDREGYAELEVDAKVELIRSLIPLGLMHIEELLDEEVTALAGERYARKDPSVGGRRHGSNPGTVGLAGQRVPIRVPRIRHVTEREIPLRSYEALHGDRAVNDLLLRRVLYGISCRNYAAAAEAIPGAIGLSGSTVSRAFIQASATKLRELQERDLSGEDVVALVLDGKTFAEATMVVALGITMTGDKRFLGFVETDTENEQVLTPFLRSLVERGLDVSQGLPYRALAQFHREIGKYVDDDELARLAQFVFVPINLNTASDDDILSIPGVGPRLLHEFKEYRPYQRIEQFRREIGKYVSDDEVARLERYVTLDE